MKGLTWPPKLNGRRLADDESAVGGVENPKHALVRGQSGATKSARAPWENGKSELAGGLASKNQEKLYEEGKNAEGAETEERRIRQITTADKTMKILAMLTNASGYFQID